METFKIKFYGVRGSYPVPGRDILKVGGNTACVKIEVGKRLIIIDAGTGIIKLGNELFKEHLKTKKPVVATVLFSHMHHDHNQGFPFFKPVYIDSTILHIFGPRFFDEEFEEILSGVMNSPFFPVKFDKLNSTRTVKTVIDSELLILKPDSDCQPSINSKSTDLKLSIDDIVIKLLKGKCHPDDGVMFYRIEYKGKSVVYASDTEGTTEGDRELIEFARGCDVLIHDAQFTSKDYSSKKGYGHSTPEMASVVAQKSNVKKLILSHHNPEYSDTQIKLIEKKCRQLFSDCRAAREGMEIQII